LRYQPVFTHLHARLVYYVVELSIFLLDYVFVLFILLLVFFLILLYLFVLVVSIRLLFLFTAILRSICDVGRSVELFKNVLDLAFELFIRLIH
jgi:hypothetical protein